MDDRGGPPAGYVLDEVLDEVLTERRKLRAWLDTHSITETHMALYVIGSLEAACHHIREALAAAESNETKPELECLTMDDTAYEDEYGGIRRIKR